MLGKKTQYQSQLEEHQKQLQIYLVVHYYSQNQVELGDYFLSNHY